MTAIRVSTYVGPGCDPVIHSVPRPRVPDCGALIRIEACGVCGTDLHILAGHWPKPLPWPLTLGHELVGVIEEKGAALETDFMGHSLALGDRVMLPPLMACGACYYCVHYPERANKCLNPNYSCRYLTSTLTCSIASCFLADAPRRAISSWSPSTPCLIARGSSGS